jgi:N-acetylmuramoyl-L-alanine amidase
MHSRLSPRASRVGTSFILAALVAAAPARAEPPKTNVPSNVPLALSVRQEVADRETRLVFSLGACVGADSHVLQSPARAIVDLPEVNFQIDPRAGLAQVGLAKAGQSGHRRHSHSVGSHTVAANPAPASVPSGSLVASYRFGRLAPGKSRIVVDLGGPAEIAASCAPAPDGSFELTLALKPQDEAAFQAAARAGAEMQARAAADIKARAAAETSPEKPAANPDSPPSSSSWQKPLVVLDPGHGGVDAGALGRDHAVEKFIVLDFAKALAAKLREGGRYKVVLTREDDSFVPLRERVRLARRLGAALFVSLHADALASDSDGVRGATVYTVSDRASDAEAARVAEHENKADAEAGVEAKEDASDVNDILFDLTRRETRAYSHVFARSLAEYWKSAAHLNKNPRRSAGFVVLKAPDVPSALLELGYLSNAADAADLTSPGWREKASAQVARAIDAFFAAQAADKSPAAPGEPALKATQSGGN